MKSTIFLSSLTVLASLVISSSVMGQTTNDVQGQLSSKDFKFAKEAAEGNQQEVALGEIAKQNAQEPAVRDFGTRMVQDHQKSNLELTQVIAQKGASASTEPGWMDKKTISHLQGLKGPEFDRAYMKDMVRDHKEDIKLFQEEASNGEDAELKNYASKSLPTLQEHLNMAQDAEAKLSSSASK